jgi:peptide deformylase
MRLEDFDTATLVPSDAEILTKKPPLFDFENDGDQALPLADLLVEKMKEFNGVGLSANQINIPARVFVVALPNRESFAFFNPQIIGVSPETCQIEEGCLSIPGLFLPIRRPKAVSILWQDVTGFEHAEIFDGIMGRIILHEYDHMEGISFLQHSTSWMIKRRLNKLARQAVKNAIKNSRQQEPNDSI